MQIEPKACFQVDKRFDLYEAKDQLRGEPEFLKRIEKQAKSIACMIPQSRLVQKGNKYTVYNITLKERVCTSLGEGVTEFAEGQRYTNQPAAGFGTAFLIGVQHVLTAGHCLDPIQTGLQLKDIRFIFGHHMVSETEVSSFSENDIYEVGEVVCSRFDKGGKHNDDWAIVRLNKPVSNREPLSDPHPIMLSDANLLDKDVYMLGHPTGLPLKVAHIAQVTNFDVNEKVRSFPCNLDAFGGNSGSPVFIKETGQVAGILVRGQKPDYINTGGKAAVRIVPWRGTEHCQKIVPQLAQILAPIIKQKKYLDMVSRNPKDIDALINLGTCLQGKKINIIEEIENKTIQKILLIAFVVLVFYGKHTSDYTLPCIVAVVVVATEFFNKNKINERDVSDEELYKKAIELSPSNSPPSNALLNLGKIQTNVDEKRKLYSNAIKANPKNSDAYLHLGLTLAPGESFQISSKMLTNQDFFLEAIEFNPTSSSAWLALANNINSNDTPINVKGQKFTKASLCLKAIECDPYCALAYLSFAETFNGNECKKIQINGKQVEMTAEKCILQAINLNPDLPEAYLKLGKMATNGIIKETLIKLFSIRPSKELFDGTKMNHQQLFEKVLELDHNNSEALRALQATRTGVEMATRNLGGIYELIFGASQ